MQKVHMIGNAHIDPVWLWQWQEGYAEIKATFLSALDRLDEFSGFVFSCAGACYYQWVEENAPEMFERIVQRVAEGRWVIVGGMWIQPDLNMPSGEALSRQLLYAQRYFAEKFGKTARIGYNVDSFGQSAYLPQLYKNAGMSGYVWMRPSRWEKADAPQGAFNWQSPDGSRILSFHIPDDFGGYTSVNSTIQKISRMQEIAAETGAPMMCFYGVGNHGGGPTIEVLNKITKYMDENPGEAVFSDPDSYFADLPDNLPVHEGEMQHHASGCYSTFSIGKAKNRRSENALLQAEAFGILSRALAGHKPNKAALDQAWQNVMFNQFHDLMCGCSIRSGLEDAIVTYDEALSIAAREENAALQKISWKIDTMMGRAERVRSKQDGILWGRDDLGTPVVLFNPHPYEVEGIAAVRGRLGYAEDAHGVRLPTQQIRAERTNGEDHIDTIVQAKLPPLGYRLVMLYKNDPQPEENSTFATQTTVGNDRIRAKFDAETGAMTSLALDGREMLRQPTRTILVDIAHCDTWAHNVFTFDKEVGVLGNAQFRVLEEGPVRSALRVTTHFGQTTLTQIFRAYQGSDQLEVETKLDLHEKHVLVKLEIAPNLAGSTEISEVPLGVIERKQTGMEEPCARFFALSGEGGIAIVNDGKHSYSCENGVLRFTVANSSMFADHYGQDFRDDTAEYLDIGEQKFNYVIAPFAGNWADALLHRRADQLNKKIVSIQETYHDGPLAQEGSLFAISEENVSLECIKRAENGRGTIVRVRETCEKPTEVCVEFGSQKAKVQLGAFQQKTVFLPDDLSEAPAEVLITEEEIG